MGCRHEQADNLSGSNREYGSWEHTGHLDDTFLSAGAKSEESSARRVIHVTDWSFKLPEGSLATGCWIEGGTTFQASLQVFCEGVFYIAGRGDKMIRGLRQIEPYVAGAQPAEKNMIKLNTNENAYGASPKVREALASFDADSLRKYSTLDQADLRAVLAENLQVRPEQLMIANGSDDVLSIAFLAFFNNDEPVLFPDLTYGFYKVWADLYRVNYHEVPLAEDFTIKTEDYLADNGGIILTNPNAPTGIYKPLAEIEAILQANRDVVVILDEAYINFGGQSAINR